MNTEDDNDEDDLYRPMSLHVKGLWLAFVLMAMGLAIFYDTTFYSRH